MKLVESDYEIKSPAAVLPTMLLYPLPLLAWATMFRVFEGHLQGALSSTETEWAFVPRVRIEPTDRKVLVLRLPISIPVVSILLMIPILLMMPILLMIPIHVLLATLVTAILGFIVQRGGGYAIPLKELNHFLGLLALTAVFLSFTEHPINQVYQHWLLLRCHRQLMRLERAREVISNEEDERDSGESIFLVCYSTVLFLTFAGKSDAAAAM